MIGIGLSVTHSDGAPEWTPLNLTGVTVYAWHDAGVATSITKDGSNLVSQWNNLAPSAAHPAISGAPRPTYVAAPSELDGRPGIYFDNTHYLSYPAGFANTVAGGTNPVSIWAVCTWTTPVTATYHAIIGFGQASGTSYQLVRVVDNASLRAERTSTIVSSPGLVVASKKYLVRAELATGTNAIRIEKNSGGSATGTSAASLTLDTLDIGRLCYNGTTNSPHKGYIEKLLILSGVPDASNLASLYSYFTRKSGPFT